ncbi:MAG: hypothetical protein Q8908_06910 [Bacteroidota bacterium]|nr:hypothetical protein [Bacteroidota bacterium]
MKTILLFISLLLLIDGGMVNAKSTFTKRTKENNLVRMTKTIANANGLNFAMGVYVLNAKGVANGSQIALRQGDIILAVNGREVNGPNEVSPEKIAREPGEIVNYKIWRDKKVHFLNLRKPTTSDIENSEQFEVIYDEVPFFSGAIRCIVTKPKDIVKAPAILLVQSGTSGSVCNVPAENLYRKLTDNLTQRGYVCMRVERVGIGENFDQLASDQVDILLETLAFEKALHQLKGYKFVDSTQTFLFGHCTGGKICSLLAARTPVKGVIVYGTCFHPTSEALNNMLWHKLMNSKITPLQATNIMEECRYIIDGILVKKMTPTAFAEINPELTAVMRKMFNWKGGDNFLGRNIMYTHSVEKMDNWIYLRHMNTNMLAIHGTADSELTESGMVMEMVDAANYYRPGKATMVEIPKADHNFAKVGSLKKSLDLQKSKDYAIIASLVFDNEIVNSVDDWIKQINS